MTILGYSRALMALTLGFHMIFATLGVGMPIFISIAHFLGLKRNDQQLLQLANRWTKGLTILFAVGTVTGTVVGFQLSLLWPKFMALAGEAIALPLFMETFAFLVEAIFFGIYVYGKKWIKNPWVHWACSVPIAMASTASAAAITTMNSFMNTPAGFEILNGKAVNINPVAAMFNPSTPVRVGHVLVTSYTATAFILAAVAAYKLLKAHRSEAAYHRKALHLTLVAGLVLALLTGATGDLSAKFLAEHQPIKLAAMEGLFETQAKAPLSIGGVPDKESGQLIGALEIPGALSFLAWSDFSKPVQGLKEWPQEFWPPLFIHYTFDLMVGVAMMMLAVGGWYAFRRFKQRKEADQRWFLWATVLTGFMGMVGIESGWVTAEVGRAPWILWGIMRTAEAVTDSPQIPQIFWFFVAFYTVIGIVTALLMRWYFRKHPLMTPALAETAGPAPKLPPQEVYGHD